MTEAPGLGDVVFLVSRGFSYREAAAFSPKKRLAICIKAGELEGRTWNWDDMRWNAP